VILHPHRGWHQEAPVGGRSTLGKAPLGLIRTLVQLQLVLLAFKLFLFTDVSAYGCFVQSYGADAPAIQKLCPHAVQFDRAGGLCDTMSFT
jgi:hypothetical protein